MQPTIAAGRLVFARGANGNFDLFHMASPHAGADPGTPQGLEESPASEVEPALSPDGTLLAYSLGNQGDTEVILRTYPAATGRWQVSSGGGGLGSLEPARRRALLPEGFRCAHACRRAQDANGHAGDTTGGLGDLRVSSPASGTTCRPTGSAS